MFSFRVLLGLFFIVPLLEIFLLIQVGGWIGAWPTVALVVFTAVLGAWLLRYQGLMTLRRVQASLARGEVPALELLEGAMLIFGGALLLTPGFFTDTLGFICLAPLLRRKMIAWVLRHGLAFSAGGPSAQHHQGPRTFEGEFRRDDDQSRRP